MRLSTIDPLDPHTWHTLSITALADQEAGQAQGQGAQGAPATGNAGGGRTIRATSSQAAPAQGAGISALAEGSQQQQVVLSAQVRVVYTCLEHSTLTGGLSLLKAYLAAPLPDPFYYLEVRSQVPCTGIAFEGDMLDHHLHPTAGCCKFSS
jgi:hypothetical protein